MQIWIEIKNSISRRLSWRACRYAGALISGDFLIASQEHTQNHQKFQYQLEQKNALKKEARELAAEYSVIVDRIYLSIRSRQLQNSPDDLTKLKISIEKIKYLGIPRISDAANHLSIALFIYTG